LNDEIESKTFLTKGPRKKIKNKKNKGINERKKHMRNCN
jgi:hypothetical protein